MERHSTVAVEETSVDLAVDGRFVPGVLWRPAGEQPHRLVLAGHGGGFGTSGHKRAEAIVQLATHLAREHGIATAAIDQPGCGDRDGAAEEQARRREMSVEDAIANLWTRDLVEEMIGDWKALLAHLADEELEIDRIGYWGLSGGTTFGLPLVASEPRIAAAVLGLNGDVPLMRHYAPDVRCAVTWMMNLDDHFMTRESSLALFDALPTTDKRVIAYPGDHGQNLDHAVPDWGRFFAARL